MCVGLVDPDALRPIAWRQLLDAWGVPLAWTAPTAAAARLGLADHPPTFMLVVFELPDENGARLLHEARATRRALRGLLFTSCPHPATEALAWRAGALGCLDLRQPEKAFLGALQRALGGASLWTPAALRRIRAWWTRWGDPWAGLSPRQRLIAWAAVHTLSNKEIAAWLGCRAETVRTHLRRALARLGRTDRVDLARWLAQGGLLDPLRAPLLDLAPLPAPPADPGCHGRPHPQLLVPRCGGQGSPIVGDNRSRPTG